LRLLGEIAAWREPLESEQMGMTFWLPEAQTVLAQVEG
jgi:hypothetical protein